MSRGQTNESIREYWNSRAREPELSHTATTDDVYLRELEIATFASVVADLPLRNHAQIADVGCGDGYSTLSIARRFKQHHFLGLDYSEQMIGLANRRLSQEADTPQISFQYGDVLALDRHLPHASIDVDLTDRCLINLDNLESQSQAVTQIASCLKPGGHLIAVENFMEGQHELTAARRLVDLPEIPVRWHNRFLSEPEFKQMAAPHFETIEYKNFSSTYYLATRVIY